MRQNKRRPHREISCKIRKCIRGATGRSGHSLFEQLEGEGTVALLLPLTAAVWKTDRAAELEASSQPYTRRLIIKMCMWRVIGAGDASVGLRCPRTPFRS